ncbi:HVO_0234 family beta-propeller protein [Haloarchaeobius baliensis]|uniref:HVO_0234 family beta-propeller protein n=1 Tax=Haloarchaeobius baliensis TaxID=1670458 RepID=UPI003F883467
MSAEKDISLDEKRVYDGDERKATLYVASGVGCVAVDVVDERVGGFELATRGAAYDVAARDGVVAVATDEDVLVGRVGSGGEDTHVGEFEATGHGGAVAVSVVDGPEILAASPEGDLSRLAVGGGDADGDWTGCGSVDAEVRALSSELCAAEDGVYRVGTSLTHVGLDDAHDVSATGTPRAATGDGLYRLGNGWLDELTGDATVVESDGGETGTADADEPERAHAVVDGELVALSAGEWLTYPDQPEGTVVGVAYDRTTYLVTGEGRVFAAADDGWRSQSLGVPDVAGVATVGPN